MTAFDGVTPFGALLQIAFEADGHQDDLDAYLRSAEARRKAYNRALSRVPDERLPFLTECWAILSIDGALDRYVPHV